MRGASKAVLIMAATVLLPSLAFAQGALTGSVRDESGGVLPGVTVEALEFADQSALHYAEIRADLKKRGALIGANHLLIAAHARALGLTLVTNNTAEFERVRGLAIENWTAPPRRRR